MEHRKCQKCDGCGKVECVYCHGTGYINLFSLALYNYPAVEAQVCSHCKGTGENDCHYCGGEGEI